MLSHLRGMLVGTRRCENGLESSAGLHFAARRIRALILLLLFAVGLHVPLVAAQGLDPAALLRPATDTWPSYNGDYSGRRFSPLDQINATNIDRKSTRLNSSHVAISYAVFCLKKKK